MKSWYAVLVAAAFMSAARPADAQTQSATAINPAVIAKLAKQFGVNSKVTVHLDLSQTFQTKSRRSLVIAKQSDEESSVKDGGVIE